MSRCPSFSAVIALAALMACGNSSAAPSTEAVPAPEPIGELAASEPGEICVTNGSVTRAGDTTGIDAAKVRAVVPGTNGDAAEMRFVYAGPSDDVSRLASGQVRMQLGLKLRAADGCNLVYVMWRFSPGRPHVEVSLKRNRGKSTHAQCGTGGYQKIKPAKTARITRPRVGGTHRLAAEIHGDELVVTVDGVEAWRGNLGNAARDLRGPAGLRTDNVALDSLELRTAASRRAPVGVPVKCR